MQLDARVGRAGEAAAAQGAGAHAEVAPVLLHEDVRRDLRRAKDRVRRLVDAEVLRDAVGECRVGVVPARLEFHERQLVGRVAVHLVGAEVDERRLDAVHARRLQQVKRPHRIGVEVVERDARGAVVARLRRRVHDGVRLQLAQQRVNPRAVADVEFVMLEILPGAGEPLLHPSRVAAGSEEDRALIAVHSVHVPAECGEVGDHFRADESGRTGDEKS